ncbi:unnamed protein product [Prorocentrum cordatum]|uniref:Uncharacterized protein n=1 Tax=Prorocentrum cordatum TaxID=2364126 RepID=A0ABN9QXS2_9DINO|nr:unnamed protein product [Polarella glacialis]
MAARTPAALRQSLEAEARRLSGPRLKPRARGQPRAGSEGLDSKPADSLAEGSTVSVCVKRRVWRLPLRAQVARAVSAAPCRQGFRQGPQRRHP